MNESLKEKSELETNFLDKLAEYGRILRTTLDVVLIAVLVANTLFVISLRQDIHSSEIFRVRPADVLKRVEQSEALSLKKMELLQTELVEAKALLKQKYKQDE